MSEASPLRYAALEPRPAPPARPTRLDAIHHRMLQILERDGRATVSSIAREVGLTDNAVRYRLRRLRSTGVLRRVTVHVDPARLGRSTAAVVLLRLGTGADLERIARAPGVAGLWPTRGAYQAAALVVARDSDDILRFLSDLRRDAAVLEATVLDVSPGAELPVLPSACTRGAAAV